jgi:pimeloyl-ACP methyl ester carboxylesterase
MKRWRVWVLRGAVCAGTWLVFCAAIGMVAVEGALHPGRLVLEAGDAIAARQIAIKNAAEFSDVGIEAADGATLRAWSIRPASANGDAVILLHGLADNRTGMLGNADMLLRHGFAVLLPDARAHGESGGAIATYGWLEADDVARWVHWVEQAESPRCIDGLGDSMGGAELLSSLRADARFCAVIAESTFSSFRWASYERVGQALHTGTWLGRWLLRPAVEAGLLYARIRYGADLAGVSPQRAVASSRVPVMLIHGLADSNLAPANSERIREADSRVELWEPEGAEHCGASSAAPVEYERRVVDWFRNHDSR